MATDSTHAQQVVANGTTVTASGTINTGVLGSPAGYGLYALNNGIIDSFSALSVTTGGAGSDAARAESGGSIALFDGTSVSTMGGSAAGIFATGIRSVVDATDTTVFTSGSNSYGVEATQGGAVNLTDGSVKTVGSMGYGLFAFQGDARINAKNVTIDTTGGAGYGARGNASGHIVLNGGSITTAGSGADALITVDSTATIDLTNTIIYTSGPAASGANAFFGEISLDNATVTTVGDGSHGARVDNAGTLAVTDGSFKTFGNSSFGLLSAAGSRLTATNATVVTSGASGIGASAQFGGQLTLNGGRITTSGASAAGLFSVGLLTAQSSTTVLLDDAATPAAGPTGSSITANGVTVRTSGSGSHGASIRGGSSLAMDNSTVTVSGAGGAALYSSAYDAGASRAEISNSTLASSNGAGIRTSGTTLNATFLGSSLAGNPDLLEVVANGTLNLIASSSTLTGAAVTDAGSSSNVTLENGTTWKMTGSSNLTNLMNASSLIDFSPPVADATLLSSYKTLTAVNYAGEGGVIDLNTYLAGDGSPSDQLVIDGGAATGSSLLSIRNSGGGGAETTADGILVVDAQIGATTAAASFALNGEARGGAFDYRLYRGSLGGGDADDWFLRSSFIVGPQPAPPVGPNIPVDPPSDPLPPGIYPIIGPELATYGVVQPIARTLGLSALGTYEDRFGARVPACIQAPPNSPQNDGKQREPNCPTGFQPSAAWGRVFGQHIDDHYQAFADPRASGSLGGFQAGIDLWGGSLAEGQSDTAGFYLGFANADVDIDGLVTNSAATNYELAHAGHMSLNAWSAGAYFTHVGDGGWYLDAVLQGTRYDGSASTESARLDTRGSGFLASLEAGYPVPIPALGEGFVLEPQGQIVWQHTQFDHENDGLGDVALGNTSGASGRIGVKAAWSVVSEGGKVWQPYLKADFWQDWSGSSTVVYSGFDQIPLVSDGRRLQLGGGVTVSVRDNLSLYAKADYQFAIGNTENRDGIGAAVGLRYRW